MKRAILLVAASSAIVACGKAAPDAAENVARNNPAPVETAAVPEANATLPDDRTPLEEPNGPIDPKSAESAGQVVQSYGALIEQRRFPEAERLWSDATRAREFSDSFGHNDETHLEIGKPSDPEGAAGSIYVTVPVVFYGEQGGGKDFRKGADVILRRVNDVPGSTAAQRRWHIERIDWKG